MVTTTKDECNHVVKTQARCLLLLITLCVFTRVFTLRCCTYQYVFIAKLEYRDSHFIDSVNPIVIYLFIIEFRIYFFIWRRGVIWSAMVRPAVDSISRKRRSRFETDRRQFTHYIYGGVVQADSHDPGEGEARAHIREKQVRGLPPPRMGQVGQRVMGHDGCASRCPRNPCRRESGNIWRYSSIGQSLRLIIAVCGFEPRCRHQFLEA